MGLWLVVVVIAIGALLRLWGLSMPAASSTARSALPVASVDATDAAQSGSRIVKNKKINDDAYNADLLSVLEMSAQTLQPAPAQTVLDADKPSSGDMSAALPVEKAVVAATIADQPEKSNTNCAAALRAMGLCQDDR